MLVKLFAVEMSKIIWLTAKDWHGVLGRQVKPWQHAFFLGLIYFKAHRQHAAHSQNGVNRCSWAGGVVSKADVQPAWVAAWQSLECRTPSAPHIVSRTTQGSEHALSPPAQLGILWQAEHS